MMSLKRKIFTSVMSATIAFGVAAFPVSTIVGTFGPQTAQAACNSLTVYERTNKGGFHSAALACRDIANLKNEKDGITLICDGNGPFSLGTWNDCISSFAANVSGGNTQMCFWSDENYSGDGLKLNPDSAGWWNMPAWLDNKTSSIELASSDCFGAGNQS